jgi:glycosyltransferase involved in cell wall biosynthesis
VRVALVTHQFFPRFHTGVERLALNLAGQLRRMGHECVVVTPAEHSSGTTGPYAVDGTHVRPLEAPRADLARPWIHDRKLGPRVRRVLEEERIELVHVMQPMRLPQSFAEALALGVPVVAHVADFGYPCARITMRRRDGTLCRSPEEGAACAAACGIRGAGERLEWARQALGSAAAVVSPCRFTTELHRQSGFDTSGWLHIPWGTDYALYPARLEPPGGGRLTIGFLGTLLEHKGARVAVEAVRLLAGAPVELRLFGASFHEADYERSLRTLAADDRRIRFEGTYQHVELPRILSELDAVVIPSLWHENLPTTGLNAAAAGVPLLVSDVGGLVELIEDYDCGLSFRRGDAADLAALLDRLLDDRAALADARRRIVDPPSLEEEAWRIERVYEGALRPA